MINIGEAKKIEKNISEFVNKLNDLLYDAAVKGFLIEVSNCKKEPESLNDKRLITQIDIKLFIKPCQLTATSSQFKV